MFCKLKSQRRRETIKTKNKTYMLDYLQETCLKILDEKSAYKILPVFYKKIYKRVHIKDILLNSLISCTCKKQHVLAPDLQPPKNLRDLFIYSNRNGCTIRGRSSQTFPLRDKRDKTENYGSCELHGCCRFSVFREIELFFI